MKPYLALDIETTGIDLKNSQVLQLAALYVDGTERTEFNVLVDNGRWLTGEPFALQLNAWILKELVAKESRFTRATAYEAQIMFETFLKTVAPTGKITVAGKNAAGFDLPILSNQGFSTERFSHRVIDVGTLYLTDFGYVPTLNEINTKLGRDAVAHDALADCKDVVAAIDAKFGGTR